MEDFNLNTFLKNHAEGDTHQTPSSRVYHTIAQQGAGRLMMSVTLEPRLVKMGQKAKGFAAALVMRVVVKGDDAWDFLPSRAPKGFGYDPTLQYKLRVAIPFSLSGPGPYLVQMYAVNNVAALVDAWLDEKLPLIDKATVHGLIDSVLSSLESTDPVEAQVVDEG